MLRRFRPRLTYANVVSTLCLFILLGGTAWAVATNNVGTRQLRDQAVTTRKLHRKAVTTEKLTDGAVTAAKIHHLPHVTRLPDSAFSNNWHNYGAGYPPGYYKDAVGIVHLTGALKLGKVPSVVLTMPFGVRPAPSSFAAGSDTGQGVSKVCTVWFDYKGQLHADVGCDSGELSLDGITYRPWDQPGHHGG
jgi:hypothetical protein